MNKNTSIVLLVVAVLLCAFAPMKQKKLEACRHEHKLETTAFQKCPYDGYGLIWNGKSRVINAVRWYEMKCVSGHITLSKTTH